VVKPLLSMSKYEIGKRIECDLTLKAEYYYKKTYGFSTTNYTIYKFVDADGEVLVWNTSSILGIEFWDEKGHYQFDGVHKGDSCRLKGTVKALGEYKGEPQVELTRCKAISITHKPVELTKEELEEQKRGEQLASIVDGDLVWNMPYRQYKEHYADCETLAGSFVRHRNGDKFITVIIRKGRLVNSGVRGEHFKGYELINENNGTICYRAVSLDNALKRASKEFPENTWQLNKIYD